MLLRVWLAHTARARRGALQIRSRMLLFRALTPRPGVDQLNPEILEVASVAGGECRPPRGDDESAPRNLRGLRYIMSEKSGA